jgi:hypothetical protein
MAEVNRKSGTLGGVDRRSDFPEAEGKQSVCVCTGYVCSDRSAGLLVCALGMYTSSEMGWVGQDCVCTEYVYGSGHLKRVRGSGRMVDAGKGKRLITAELALLLRLLGGEGTKRCHCSWDR